MDSGITIRKTTLVDAPQIIQMIQELADFEKMPLGPQMTAEQLVKDGSLDGSSEVPLFHSYVAESQEHLIGFTISFFSYSTWQGKSYFLEDLYVKPDYRKMGVGKKLFVENVKFANVENCSRFEFHVLNWNPAKKFYEKLGASNLSASEGWEFYRLNTKNMEQILNK